MPKNIVVCSDGTGNTSIKGRGTNVFKLYEAVDTNGHLDVPELTPQVTIYDDGVGTERMKMMRMATGAVGFGLAAKVRGLYTEICRHYDPGDSLYFFGFSRGAFTVRTLAGLIAACGIIKRSEWRNDRELRKLTGKAYQLRRRRQPSWIAYPIRRFITGLRRGELNQFRAEHACVDDNPRLRFIGVWDTVDAVGFPIFRMADMWNTVIYRYKFPNRKLSDLVESAAHALSIDDSRQTFHPLLWDLEGDPASDRIDQVWFSGVHANVGGGYPKQGMSMTTLDWMMAKAEAQGLRFIPTVREHYRQARNATDKLYDSRAGLKSYYRYMPRDIAALCADSAVQPKVHIDVVRRIRSASDSYAPGNLPENLEVVATEREGEPPARGESPENLAEITNWLRGELDERQSELRGRKWCITVRHWTQYVAIATSVFALINLGQISLPEGGLRDFAAVLLHGGGDAGHAFSELNGVVRDKSWARALPFVGEGFWQFLAGVVGVLGLAYFVGRIARRKMEDIESLFWRRTFAPGKHEGEHPPPIS